jgi:hypothetical protein
MLKQYADDIINRTNYTINCHGLQAGDAAIEIAKHYFAKESIPFENWTIREIPLVDDSGEYPVAICLCVNNEVKKLEITLNIMHDGKLHSICPDELAEIYKTTIKDAINHPTAKY